MLSRVKKLPTLRTILNAGGFYRIVFDESHNPFSEIHFSLSLPKSKLVQAANARLWDLPAACECRGISPFKGRAVDKQASFTGKQWRKVCPVMWVAVLGLNENRFPDEDPLF